jgi:hypothetical protein
MEDVPNKNPLASQGTSVLIDELACANLLPSLYQFSEDIHVLHPFPNCEVYSSSPCLALVYERNSAQKEKLLKRNSWYVEKVFDALEHKRLYAKQLTL